jgi:hypothetical protein
MPIFEDNWSNDFAEPARRLMAVGANEIDLQARTLE